MFGFCLVLFYGRLGSKKREEVGDAELRREEEEQLEENGGVQRRKKKGEEAQKELRGGR